MNIMEELAEFNNFHGEVEGPSGRDARLTGGEDTRRYEKIVAFAREDGTLPRHVADGV
jgi:hypothetical protein